MRILALDLSTSTGFAFMEKEGEAIRVLDCGNFKTDRKIEEFGDYPVNFVNMSGVVGDFCASLVDKYCPDKIVIEETNIGRSRYTQKCLEFIHLSVLVRLNARLRDAIYISTSEWRAKKLGLSVSNTKKMAKPFIKEFEELKKKFLARSQKKQRKR